MAVLSTQQIAEYGCVLRGIVDGLGGLAHDNMSLPELDRVIDNMVSKGVPSEPSRDIIRWIHNRRMNPKYKVRQIFGARVDENTDKTAILPECFGKFHDPTAIECKACLDRTACSMRMRALASRQETGQVVQEYPVGKTVNVITIKQILSNKFGQIVKTLGRGTKVVLEVAEGNLKVSALGTKSQTDESEDTPVMAKKNAPVVEEELELEPETEGSDDETLDLNLAEEVEEQEAEEVAEEAAAQPVSSKKAAPASKKASAPAAVPAAPAVAAPAKVKAKKEKPVLTPSQQKFQDSLGKLGTQEEKWAYSKKVASQLKLAYGDKSDERINHMTRVMAIKKALAAVDAKKPATPAAPAKK